MHFIFGKFKPTIYISSILMINIVAVCPKYGDKNEKSGAPTALFFYVMIF